MQAKQWTRFFMIPVLWCSFNTWAADVLQVRQLNLGVQQHLDFPDGIKKVAVADDQIVHVAMDRVPGQGNTAKLLLTPLKVGATSLKVWNGKSAEPHAFLLEVQPSVHVRDNRQYQHLADMVRKETAIKEAKGREIASLHAGQLQHKSNVVQVDVKIVELNKNKLKQAGLNIFSTAANSRGFSFGVLSAGGGGGTEASPFSQAFGLLMDFGKANIRLNLGMLEGSGMARVLAQPSLLAISGQSANFLAGGEVPIPVSQGDGAVSIEYKPYGIGLTVSPTILDNQRIVLKVSPESSELDYSNAVVLQNTSVPAISVRKVDTTVELGDGESFVIGGLVSQSTTSNVDRVPFLSEIPILGMMFKKQEFSRKERELVIVVTPRLVKPIANHAFVTQHLPGAEQEQRTPAGFWSSYFGPSGGSEQLPGFSQ